MKKRNICRWLALCMTLVLMLTSLPLSVVAETGILASKIETVANESGETVPQHPTTATEVVSLREENVKHYQMPDGTMQAVIYGETVHRKDANGQWQEIDNRLSVTDVTGRVYRTTDQRAAFAQNKPCWVIQENGYLISMAYMPMEPEVSFTSVRPVQPSVMSFDVQNGDERGVTVEEEPTAKLRRSTVTYANVAPSVDLEYILKGNDIKENIIVRAPNGQYDYSFTLTLWGLDAVCNDDGSVSLNDQGTGEEKYILPAPYMYDANGVLSYDVFYTLTPTGADGYILTVTADTAWMEAEERVYPVVIDPTVTGNPLWDTYINYGAPDVSHGSKETLLVSEGTTVYMQYSQPTIPESYQILEARLQLSFYHDTPNDSGATYIGIHRVNIFWRESLTWTQANAYANFGLSDQPIATLYLTKQPEATAAQPRNATVDITDTVRGWYDGTVNNNGIALKFIYSTALLNRSVRFYSSESDYAPVLRITYEAFPLEDGVYAIRNFGHNNMWMDTQHDSPLVGKYIQQYAYAQAPTGTFSRGGLFKISRVGNTGRYVIRLMTNNALTFGRVGNYFKTKEIPPDDSDVPIEDTFYIESTLNGYKIIPFDRSGALASMNETASGSAGGVNARLYKASIEEGSRASWTFIPYEGADRGEVIITNPVTELSVGKTYDLDAYMYSTRIGVNGPVTYSVNNTNVATINATTGMLTALTKGAVIITARHIPSGYQCSLSISVKKRAIIILPGIMGSQIFADGNITIPSQGVEDPPNTISNGTRLWDPSKIDLLLIREKVWALACDPSGEPIYPTKVNPPTINQDDLGDGFQYGALDIYRRLYNEVYSHFYSETCDIVFYEYDWRKDPYDTAQELSSFINEKQYGGITFISHSMGGIVSSYYLSLGTYQRDLVEKHISIGTPYLGAVEMPYVFSTGNIRDSIAQNWILSLPITDIISNIPSIYALFPYEQNWMMYLEYYDAENYPSTIGCATFSSTMNALSLWMPNWNNDLSSRAISNRNRLFLDDGKHITNCVDSYYVIGTGIETTFSICGVFDNLVMPTEFATFELSKNSLGDGTVPHHSATIGGTIPSNRTYYKHDSETQTASHVGMIEGADGDLSTIQFILSIIDGSIENYTAGDLSSLFGITYSP